MIITRHMIEERLEELDKETPWCFQDLARLEGKIEECRHWLRVLEQMSIRTPEIDLNDIRGTA